MKRVRAKVGDIILVPFDETSYVVGKVYFVSKWFTNVILVGFSKLVINEVKMPEILPEFFHKQIYTSKACINTPNWHRVGNVPLNSNEEGLSLRQCAGEVWVEDTLLRVASSEDEKNLPELLVHGQLAVEIVVKSWIESED